MARIVEFEAGPGKIEPSERGPSTLHEAGVAQTRYANQQAEAIRRQGESIGRGLASIGKAFGDVEAKAQEHTDAMAELEWHRNATDLELAAIGGVNRAATPTKNGEPLESHPGNGAATLDPEATVPTPGQYATSTAGILKQTDNILEGLTSALGPMGVSQKEQDRLAMHREELRGRLAVHAAVQAGNVDLNYLHDSLTKTTNNLAASVSKGDIELEPALKVLENNFEAAGRGMTGDFKVKGAELMTAQKREARATLITQDILTKAAAGNLDAANRTLDQYDSDLGEHRQKIQQQIRNLNEAHIRDQNAQDELETKERDKKQADYTWKVFENLQKPPDQRDPNFSRTKMRGPDGPFAGHLDELDKWEKRLDSTLNHTIDPGTSTQIASRLREDILSRKITRPEQIDQYWRAENPDNSLSWDDRNKLHAVLKDMESDATFKASAPGFSHAMEAAKETISQGYLGQKDAAGAQRYAEFFNHFYDQYRQLQKEGRLPPNALDFSDPNSLISQSMQHYIRTDEEKFNDYMKNYPGGGNAPGATPPGAGKPIDIPKDFKGSPSDYIKQHPEAAGKLFNMPNGNGVGRFPQQRSENTPQLNQMSYAPSAEGGLKDSGPQKAIAAAMNEIFPVAEAKQAAKEAPEGTAHAVTDQTQRLQNVRGYGQQLTGAIVLNGHTYHFINGGGGRGSIPFGTYQVSNFRTAQTRSNQGLINLGDTFDLNDVYDPMARGTRGDLRIHAAHGQGTLGCIGILGGPEKFKQFAQDMKAEGVKQITLGPTSVQLAAR